MIRSVRRGAVSIDFDQVGFAYPDGPPVLRDVTLHVEPNTRLAVVGETGSGKTTLAKLLTRLMDPTTGAVRLDGVDLREVPFASLRERVVMVPQDGFLFDATVREIRFAQQPEIRVRLCGGLDSVRVLERHTRDDPATREPIRSLAPLM